MYLHWNNAGTFVILPNQYGKPWGNQSVYGSIYLCKDFDFYSRSLDAYQVCSKALLGKNHIRDMHHRVCENIKLITFLSPNLESLHYREGETIQAELYVGNKNHPKISRRFKSRHWRYRIVEGFDKKKKKTLGGFQWD